METSDAVLIKVARAVTSMMNTIVLHQAMDFILGNQLHRIGLF